MISFTVIEILWLLGLMFFGLVIIFGKNSERGWAMKAGASIIFLGYLFKTQEYMLSFEELALASWVVRVGITLIMYDVARRTQIENPISKFKQRRTNK